MTMIDVSAELDRIHGLEWDKQPGELEHLVYRLERERDILAGALHDITTAVWECTPEAEAAWKSA